MLEICDFKFDPKLVWVKIMILDSLTVGSSSNLDNMFVTHVCILDGIYEITLLDNSLSETSILSAIPRRGDNSDNEISALFHTKEIIHSARSVTLSAKS